MLLCLESNPDGNLLGNILKLLIPLCNVEMRHCYLECGLILKYLAGFPIKLAVILHFQEDRRRKKDRKDRRVESKRKDKETGVEVSR